jgi:hypothetical protein
LPLFALVLGLVLIRPERPWRKAATMVAVALLVVWAGYLFHISWLTLQRGELYVQSPGAVKYHIGTWSTAHSFAIPVPAGEYLTGVAEVFRHSRWGHPSFFLGRISPQGGWKLYYPVLILLKWPIIVLLLAGSFLYLSLKGRIGFPRELRIMLLFPAIFLAFAVLSRIDIGDRHVLPLYPFLLLLCAGFGQFQTHRRAVLLMTVLAIGLQIGDTMRYAPDYLSYFNAFVDPRMSYRLFSDSNLDWGEGLIALRQYQDRHPNEQIHLAYFGSVYPSQYGINAAPLRENERTCGTVVVSATHLSGQLLRRPGSYEWLFQYPRTAILNHTLHVFRVPEEALRAAE